MMTNGKYDGLPVSMAAGGGFSSIHQIIMVRSQREGVVLLRASMEGDNTWSAFHHRYKCKWVGLQTSSSLKMAASVSDFPRLACCHAN